MSELRDKIYDLLKEPQVVSLASIAEDGKPWVRFVVASVSEDLVVWIATHTDSRKVAQINANPNVHITCGSTDLANMGPYLQIDGLATVTADDNVRDALWSAELENYFEGPKDPNFSVVEIVPEMIEYWSPGKMEPEVFWR